MTQIRPSPTLPLIPLNEPKPLLKDKTVVKAPVKDTRDPKLLAAARMYEAQFLRQLVTEMKKTVQESDFLPANQAEKIFQGQLDDEMVNKWVDRGGVGFGDLIYDQIMERYGTQITRPKMPVKDPQTEGKKIAPQTWNFSSPVSQEINSPWPGTVKSVAVQPGMTTLQIQHDSVPLQSELILLGKGQIYGAPDLEQIKSFQQIEGPGKKIHLDKTVGRLDPGGTLIWRWTQA